MSAPTDDAAWWAGECELMEIAPRRACAHCRKLPDVAVLDLEEVPPGGELRRGPSESFVAKFSGRCTDCGHSIEPGDMIRSSINGYVHEECQ